MANLVPDLEASDCVVAFLIPRLVSISITNGPVFCGVVGAVARHEYTGRIGHWTVSSLTWGVKMEEVIQKFCILFFFCFLDTVIGPKVSLVARMITAYPGLVSCDEVTYLRSMLPAYNFKKLPEKMMKNISNPGKTYEYLGHRRCM